MLRLILSLALLGGAPAAVLAAAQFAVAVTPAPVLNRPDFRAVFGGQDGRTLLKDGCGQLRAVEFVALPGTVFEVEETVERPGGTVYRVTTAEYHYSAANGYFVDARSVRMEKSRPPERTRSLPSRAEILANLEKRVGTRYIWGGNVAAGVTALTGWYPPTGAVDPALWQLAGVDCSGLLYEATGGYTPRNTSALIRFGAPVAIAGKSVQQLATVLKPLDLIVWPGHVLILLEGERVIESHLDCAKPLEGVRIRPLDEALADIVRKRKPVDTISSKGAGEFVVRRWYGI